MSKNPLCINEDAGLRKQFLNKTNMATDDINNSFLRKKFKWLTMEFLKSFDDYFLMQKNVIISLENYSNF
jgi:hypothetical protein